MPRPEPLLALALGAWGSIATVEIETYGGTLAFAGDTPRREGWLAGAYARAEADGLLVEADYERLGITGDPGDAIQQQDATLMLGAHPQPDATARVGVHLAWEPGRGGPVARSLIADATVDGAGGLWTGATAAASRFTVAEPAVVAAQAGVRGGWTWRPADRVAIVPSAGATLIGLDRDPGFGRHHYPSLDGAIAVTLAAVRVEASAWTGLRCYQVDRQGFVVYDLPALFHRGWMLGATVDLGASAWCRFGIGSESFTHAGASGAARADIVLFALGLTL